MQITKAEVTPIDLKLHHPLRMAGQAEISQLKAIFIRLETRQGGSAWGCTIAHPGLTGEKPEDVIRACRECATLLPDLNPLNIELALGVLASRGGASGPARRRCAPSTWPSTIC